MSFYLKIGFDLECALSSILILEVIFMKYTKLGNSDLNVSRICLGCMGFGNPETGMHKWTLDEKESNEIIHHAIDSGINFFDTAMAYQGGTSERFLGKAIRESQKRDDLIVATKYTPISKLQKEEGISSTDYINQCLEASLDRLGLTNIDLYIMHSWDFLTPMEETLTVLNDAIKAGKVRALGISNCYAWQLARINDLAKQMGLQGFVSIQSHYNLIAREDERELVNYCKEENIAMTPYSSLASGRLSRKPGETSKRNELDAFAKTKYNASEDKDLPIIERVNEIAEKRNVTMTQVALAWLLTKVKSPVVGATKFHHIDDAVCSVSMELTEQEKNYLEELYTPHSIVGVLANRGWEKQAK